MDESWNGNLEVILLFIFNLKEKLNFSNCQTQLRVESSWATIPLLPYARYFTTGIQY